MVAFYGIGEVFVKVKEIDRAIGFYKDLLGLEVEEAQNEQVYIRFGTSHLVLKKEGSPGHQAGGPMHFAFVVSPDTIDVLAEQFGELDCQTRGPLDFPNCRAFFVFDPDGNEVEFSDLYYPKYADPKESS